MRLSKLYQFRNENSIRLKSKLLTLVITMTSMKEVFLRVKIFIKRIFNLMRRLKVKLEIIKQKLKRLPTANKL